MWKIDKLGLAVWQDEQSRWCFDLRGGRFGIALLDSDGLREGLSQDSGRLAALSPVDQDVLPGVCEQFVRGDELHLTYPQGEGVYELRIALRPIETTENRLTVEATIAIQTDRLDTHPKIDLIAAGRAIAFHVPAERVSTEGESAPISVASDANHAVGILLGHQDSPFTTNCSTDSLLKLRLFGDFLEKGVIRKARPWIVVSRNADPPSMTDLESRWRELCASPLPLTA
jgi:hypothetical protein